MNSENRCPRCDEANLKSWDELDEEEREVVKRLPAAAEYSARERQNSHFWCPRCWYEERHPEQSA